MNAEMPASFFTFSGLNPSDSGKSDVLLFHATRPEWVRVNGTTLEIAEQIDDGKSVEAVAVTIADKYGIPFSTAQADVSGVTEKLQGLGFLNYQSESAPCRKPVIHSIFLHLTTRCNFACPHCYIHQEGLRNIDLPDSLVIQMMDELKGLGGNQVTFSGGEPLLHPNIRQLLVHAQRTQIRVQVLTNGSLIDKDWALFLADQDVSNIQISLDGSTPAIHDAIRGNGSYAKVMNAVENLQAVGMGDRLNFCTTFMKQNLHDLQNIIMMARSKGVTYVRFLPLREKGKAIQQWKSIYGADIDNYEQFFEQVSMLNRDKSQDINISCGLSGLMVYLPKEISGDGIWCPVGKKIVVDAKGNVYPCVLMMEDEFLLGNVFSDRLPQIKQSQKMAEVCKSLATRRYRIPECAACNWRNFCQAGCMGQTLDHKGTIWDTDFFCAYRKQKYQESFNAILQMQDQVECKN